MNPPVDEASLLRDLEATGALEDGMADARRVLARRRAEMEIPAPARSAIRAALESMGGAEAAGQQDAVLRSIDRFDAVVEIEVALGWAVAARTAPCWLELTARENPAIRAAMIQLIRSEGGVTGARDFERIRRAARGESAPDPESETARDDARVERHLRSANAILAAQGRNVRAVLTVVRPPETSFAQGSLPWPFLPPGSAVEPTPEDPQPARTPLRLSWTLPGAQPTPPPTLAAFRRLRAVVAAALPTLSPCLRRHLLVPA